MTLAVESANGMALDEDVMDGKEGYLFGMASGVLFDLGAAVCLLGLIQMVVFTLIFLKSLIVRQWEGTPKKGGNASLARRVGGSRKKVRFNVPRKGRATTGTGNPIPWGTQSSK